MALTVVNLSKESRRARVAICDVSVQIKKKMTGEEFVRNNRGINGTKDAPKDLPQEFLTELYDHFSERAIRFPQLPSTLSDKFSSSESTILK